MGAIVVSMWTSVDGYVAGPNDAMDWTRPDEQMMAYEQVLVDGAEVLLLGRITFNDFAGYWPNQAAAESDPATPVECAQRRYARRLDALRKVAVSASGEVAQWANTTTLPSLDEHTITTLKGEAEGDIVLYGSLSVVRELTTLKLIDKYHLLVHPVALGQGKPLLAEPGQLELQFVEAFSSGVVLAKYSA